MRDNGDQTNTGGKENQTDTGEKENLKLLKARLTVMKGRLKRALNNIEPAINKFVGYETGIFIHLGALMHDSWIEALENKDPENKNLEQIAEIFRVEEKLRIP